MRLTKGICASVFSPWTQTVVWGRPGGEGKEAGNGVSVILSTIKQTKLVNVHGALEQKKIK